MVDEGAPFFVKLLKQHCDEKRCMSANKIRSDIEKRKNRKSRFGGINNQSSLFDEIPQNSKCFDEVFKLQNKLNEAFPVKLLYTNRFKYGL